MEVLEGTILEIVTSKIVFLSSRNAKHPLKVDVVGVVEALEVAYLYLQRVSTSFQSLHEQCGA
jgi:hypothetical protein